MSSVWYNLRMEKEPTIIEVHELLLHVVNNMATKEDIAAIREEMADGFADVRAEMATKKDLADGLAAIREEMATKTEMSAGFASVRSELSEVKERLGDVEETIESLSGLTVEIDDLSGRVRRVEQQVGLSVS